MPNWCEVDCHYPMLNGTVPGVGDSITDETPDGGYDDTDEGTSDDKHRHEYNAVEVEPTCTEGGYTAYTCECGKSFKTEEAPFGHSYRLGVCTVCGEADPDFDGDVTDDCDTHTDTNNDGYCDYCDEYVIVIIDIYGINDLHGKASATDSQPGIGSLTTYLKNNMSGNSVLLSSGDMWQCA